MATLSLQIALPVPLRQLFDYLPPAGISEQQAQALPRGIRVQVKFGKRQLTGILARVNLNCTVAPDKLRAAEAIIDQNPVLADDILQLCDWASHYYQHPLGEVFCAGYTYSPAQRQGATGTGHTWLAYHRIGAGHRPPLPQPLHRLKKHCWRQSVSGAS